MVISLTLTAQHPLMFGSLTRTDDALQHLYRLVALDSSIRHADLWPRYVPTLVYGYGIPLFNFYSPLSLYPPEILHLLGLSFLNALLVGLMGYILIGAAGAYLLGRRWAGVPGGIGAAVAYTYAPYAIFNLYHRGAIGEVAGLALLPWVLWGFDRLAEYGRRRDFSLAVLFFSLLILTHNITALYGMFLLVPYCLLLWWTGHKPPRIFVHLLLAGAVAIGLTTFFWLPALAESQFVQLERMNIGVAANPATPAFYEVFQNLATTFALPERADLTRFNQPEHYSLGWPQILLGILGATLLFWREKNQRGLRGRIVVALALAAILVFTTTRLSAWLWATIPISLARPWAGQPAGGSDGRHWGHTCCQTHSLADWSGRMGNGLCSGNDSVHCALALSSLHPRPSRRIGCGCSELRARNRPDRRDSHGGLSALLGERNPPFGAADRLVRSE
jgi:uncharacterized membrane protein